MTKSLVSFLGIIGLLASVMALANCATAPVPLIYVSISPTTAQTLEGGQTLNITAAVPNDLTGAGVTWALSPVTAPGTLINATTTSVTYQAPASVTGSTTFAVVASSVVQPNKSKEVAVTVVPGPSFTTPSFPGGYVGTAYSSTIAVTGGIAPYTWTVASGALPNGLALSNANTPTVTISGTPSAVGTFTFTIQVTDSAGVSYTSGSLSIQIQAANTLRITSTSPLPSATVGTAYSYTFAAAGGTTPYTWTVATGSTLPPPLTLSSGGVLSGTPTSAVTSSFGITVTDSENPQVSNTVTFSLTINPQGTGTFTGGYAFVFHGSNNITVLGVSVPQTIVEAGTFTIAADGTTVSGVLDYNTTGGQNYIGQTFSGTAVIGTDNRGTITFNNLTQGTQSFAFAMDSTLDHGRMVELDSSKITGSGEIFKQTVSACSASGFSGNYVFGTTGGSANGTNLIYPATYAGRFSSDGISAISLGEADFNTPFSTGAIQAPSLTGTFQVLSTGGACQITFGTGPVIMMNVYPVSATNNVITKAVLVQTDPIASTSESSLFAGELDQQVGYPFTGNTSLTGTSVGVMVGQYSSNGEQSYVPDVLVAQLGISGSSYTLDYTEDQNGVVGTFNQSTNPPGYSGSFSIDTYGRVTFINLAAQMYLINVNQGVVLTTDTSYPDPLFGYFDPQTTGVTFSASTIKGTFESGTIGNAYYLTPNFSGEFTFDGTSAISGTQDTSSSSGNSSGQTVAGTYSGINGTTGFGNITFTSPTSVGGVICIISPTKFVGITTPVSSTGANPVAIVFGH